MCKVENSPLVSELARICFGLYSNSSFTRRAIQTLRPFICPLDKIIQNVPANSDALDIGCGAGEISRVLDSYEYTGFDLPHIIEEVALKVNPNSQYEKIDIQKVDFDIFSSFDIVLCNSFISELGNGEDILNSLFKSSPRYIILHRQEVTRLSTYSEEYKTYGDLNTIKCVLSEDCIKEFLEFYDFSCPQAYRLSTNLYSFLFKKNEIPQS